MNTKQTVIYKQEGGTLIQVHVEKGLPFGVPKQGDTVRHTVYGEMKCTGHKGSGSGKDFETYEVSFTIG